MDRLFECAAAWGIAAEYRDGLGRWRRADPRVVSNILRAVASEPDSAARFMARTIVVHGGRGRYLDVALPAGVPLRWEICPQGLSARDVIAQGDAVAPGFALPSHLPQGVLRLRVSPGNGGASEDAFLIVSPERSFQGTRANVRQWGVAAQLFGIRSDRNWGHGDFTDLIGLIDLAADLGAAAVGLNPLHALFDDRPAEPSPYSPSSRRFLNPLYIDLEAVPEFPGTREAGLEETVARLRRTDMVDYAAVAEAKTKALRLAYEAFRSSGTASRRAAFERFRRDRGSALESFAWFEMLRREFAAPWPQWPPPWQRPDPAAFAKAKQSRAEELGYFEFVQWLAHEQLDRCRVRARERGLSIGLYLDLAVGVRPDGFDAWCEQDAIMPGMTIGAPPDLLNRAGQDWGLAAFNPAALAARGFAPYLEMLRASMRCAGAIRLDHVLGLNRLFLVPAGGMPAEGLYIHGPFEALLAVTALASIEAGCIVIGEDLGTVPKGFRKALTGRGLWGYEVMLFQRSRKGEFRPASRYRKDALVTFATHDLPTFKGWWESRDLATRQALGLKSGETRAERQSARAALRRALRTSASGLIEFAEVVKFIAGSPSRLMMVSMEDLLGVVNQVNMPGTVDCYPNWRCRLPVSLEQLPNALVRKVADAMRQAERS